MEGGPVAPGDYVPVSAGHQQAFLGELVEPGRGVVHLACNTEAPFRVVFSHSEGPTRGRAEVLCFVVGKRRNSISTVGFGNPYQPKKQHLECTYDEDARLSPQQATRDFWFLVDASRGLIAFGAGAPMAETCRVLVPLGPSEWAKRELIAQLRYVYVESGRRITGVVFRSLRPPADLALRAAVDCRGVPLPRPRCAVVHFLREGRQRELLQRARQVVLDSPLQGNFVGAQDLFVPLHEPLDELQRSAHFEGLGWAALCQQFSERLVLMLSSAPWTLFALKIKKVEIDRVLLEPATRETKKALDAYRAGVAAAMQAPLDRFGELSVQLALPIFPIVGDAQVAHRKAVVGQLSALLADFGTLEACGPEFAAGTEVGRMQPYSPEALAGAEWAGAVPVAA